MPHSKPPQGRGRAPRRPLGARRRGIRPPRGVKIVRRIQPGADKRLKAVFSRIGSPPKVPFKPDAYQEEAIRMVAQADCLVTAPTGAGKTWIAIQAIRRIFEQGGMSWYASPLKALSNAKYAEFGTLFGEENVGILTGDRKERTDAPIIVGTTEILRNQLYDAMHAGRSLSTDLVVLDEAHYLGDEDRGVVWEEIMIYLPARIALLLLSATIGNAHQIADWLSHTRAKNCVVVKETDRPVPLFPLFLHPTGTLLPLLGEKGKSKRQAIEKRVRMLMGAKYPLLMTRPGRLPPFDRILAVLRKYRLLPAIFFLKSRADCDRALETCAGNRVTDPMRREKIAQRLGELIQNYPHIASHRQRLHLEALAVGSHHSGQLPAWKLVLESLMAEGMLDAVFATSTVAAGVNFPARTVAFLNSDRFNGREFVPLNPTEFHQMTGRAGRRGMDQIGFLLAVPTRFLDVFHVGRLINSPPTDVLSQIRINFSMVLNLLLSHTPEEAANLLSRSFADYLMSGGWFDNDPDADDPGAGSLARDFFRHLAFLREYRYVTQGGRLTDDGRWASQLRVDHPLLIAEGFRRHLFPVSAPALLAGLIASLVDDREIEGEMDKRFVPQTLLDAWLMLKEGLAQFQVHLMKRRFPNRVLLLRPAATLWAWATGHAWEEVCKGAEMEEGDLAMLVLRTADNLRHIRNLVEVFPEAAHSAAQAIDMIIREPVTYVYGV